ncbi:hypothetical protein TDIS_0356 [Thermosulfurimonas dismutans]|uniref:Uncharacterized protein n=1 Tax=Thermosulfurimonas dismutans TaxID=999894 RepID=A0A179D8D4_9BACT|nr:hypothetical protein TDIS_0356 [Thermosulfurimonas dismutans]
MPFEASAQEFCIISVQKVLFSQPFKGQKNKPRKLYRGAQKRGAL